MKKILLLIMFTTFFPLYPHTITVNNKTGYQNIKVAAYWIDAGTQAGIAYATIASVGTFGLAAPGGLDPHKINKAIDEIISKMKSEESAGFYEKGQQSDFWEKDFGSSMAIKNKPRDLGEFLPYGTIKSKISTLAKPAKFDIKTGCIRAIKAWIVDENGNRLRPAEITKSWTTDKISGGENQCASHTFDIIVKTYEDGSKKLKSIRKK
jgi:hypothetical protein